MKVKVGQLKTHLSKYLREIQETGETLEVCVREKPVAYLMPVQDEMHPNAHLRPEILKELRRDGILLTPAKRPKDRWVPKPGKARDGLEIENTIVAMRRERDW